MTLYGNVSGTWKEIDDPQVNVSGTWKQVNEIYVNVSGTWKQVYKRIVVPAGLIIPYNGTSAPSGWSLFTDADGRFIIGAGKTYAVGATGGSTSITTAASDTQGVHTGSTASGFVGSSNSANNFHGEKSAGGHTHTLTYNYTPPYYGLRLIKADSDLLFLPAKAVMFSGASLNGLTRFSSGDGKLFSPRSSIGAGGSNTISGFTSTSSGSHHHGSGKDYGSYGGNRPYNAGAHTHPNTNFNITPNLYRALLSAWTNASSAFRLQPGMYAFYENTTPPDGWYLCDGSNGTLDLRDYFVEFADEDDDGTRTGDGTLTVPNITLTSVANTHDHFGPGGRSSRCYHGSYSATHSHTITGTTPTFLPPYYALAIIQLAA
jgi:hypothetical protein